MTWKQFQAGMRDAQITAFSTSSSVATLPVTMKCVNQEFRRQHPYFLLCPPYWSHCQYGRHQHVPGHRRRRPWLSFTWSIWSGVSRLIIVLTATLASIGAAAIPSAGLVLMIIVLESVGLNPAWIALDLPC